MILSLGLMMIQSEELSCKRLGVAISIQLLEIHDVYLTNIWACQRKRARVLLPPPFTSIYFYNSIRRSGVISWNGFYVDNRLR